MNVSRLLLWINGKNSYINRDVIGIYLRGYVGRPRAQTERGSSRTRIKTILVKSHAVSERHVTYSRRIVNTVECVEQTVAAAEHQALALVHRVSKTYPRAKVVLVRRNDSITATAGNYHFALVN